MLLRIIRFVPFDRLITIDDNSQCKNTFRFNSMSRKAPKYPGAFILLRSSEGIGRPAPSHNIALPPLIVQHQLLHCELQLQRHAVGLSFPVVTQLFGCSRDPLTFHCCVRTASLATKLALAPRMFKVSSDRPCLGQHAGLDGSALF